MVRPDSPSPVQRATAFRIASKRPRPHGPVGAGELGAEEVLDCDDRLWLPRLLPPRDALRERHAAGYAVHGVRQRPASALPPYRARAADRQRVTAAALVGEHVGPRRSARVAPTTSTARPPVH